MSSVMKTIKSSGDLPTGYEHVWQQVMTIAQKVREIDNQIVNTRPDSTLYPKLVPAGLGHSQLSLDRERTVLFLSESRDETLTAGWKQIRYATHHPGDKIACTVQDWAREVLFPNPFLHMTFEERVQERASLDQYQFVKSQVYIEKIQDALDACRRRTANDHNPVLRSVEATSATNPDTLLSFARRHKRSCRYRFTQQHQQIVRYTENWIKNTLPDIRFDIAAPVF